MEDTLLKIVGKRIKAARIAKELKQTDLAKVIDSSAASISNIENGIQGIQLIDLYRVAEFLEKNACDFLPHLDEVKDAIPSIDKQKKDYTLEEADFIESLRKKEIKEE